MGDAVISLYDEELLTGAARRREIIKCVPLIPDLDNIIADYALLTARDRIDILCSTDSGCINLQGQQDWYGRHRTILNVNVNWAINPASTRNKIFWLSWSNPTRCSRWLDLSRFVYPRTLFKKSSDNFAYLNSRTKRYDYSWDSESQDIFIWLLNREVAKIL